MPHLLFLRDLAVRHEAGGYLFVHAGIRPGIPLDRQSRHDLMWIREPFLSSKEPFGPVVVHGHTPRQEPVVRPNRIGIDTGRGDGRRADLRGAGGGSSGLHYRLHDCLLAAADVRWITASP